MMRGVLAGALLLAATASPVTAQAPVTVELRGSEGQSVGMATLAPSGNGVEISVEVRGLPPGEHGIHLHAVGQCDAPGFTTAGGHFNPAGMKHGLESAEGPHAGDLPNLEVDEDGTASYEYLNTRVSLGSGANSLFDADGTALVIHAGPDDQMTDPAGDSGARIACGVVASAAATAPSAAQPVRAPSQLPRAGGPAVDVVGSGLAAFGGLLVGAGFWIRRRGR